MQRIGLLGGMSWESTALYYSLINEAVAARLGGLHSADIAMVSVEFRAGRGHAGGEFQRRPGPRQGHAERGGAGAGGGAVALR